MITVAIQRDSYVHVYGENKKLLFTKRGILHGFTSTTVAIKEGNLICVYDEKKKLLSTHRA